LTFIILKKEIRGRWVNTASAAKLLKGLLEDKVFILNLYKINNTENK